jgi:hypothetical protein
MISAATVGTVLLFAQHRLCCLGNRRVYGSNAVHAVWYPGVFELTLFCIYSPAHAILWTITTDVNWVWTVCVMVAVWVQVCDI